MKPLQKIVIPRLVSSGIEAELVEMEVGESHRGRNLSWTSQGFKYGKEGPGR